MASSNLVASLGSLGARAFVGTARLGRASPLPSVGARAFGGVCAGLVELLPPPRDQGSRWRRPTWSRPLVSPGARAFVGTARLGRASPLPSVGARAFGGVCAGLVESLPPPRDQCLSLAVSNLVASLSFSPGSGLSSAPPDLVAPRASRRHVGDQGSRRCCPTWSCLARMCGEWPVPAQPRPACASLRAQHKSRGDFQLDNKIWYTQLLNYALLKLP